MLSSQALHKMGSENANGCAQNTGHKDGDEFLDHIVQVTADETWFSFENVETKEQYKHWMHTHSLNKLKKFKQMLLARKLIATVFQARKGTLMVTFMQRGTTIKSEVYCETLKKTAQGHSEQMS
jgi:hypothetical protein